MTMDHSFSHMRDQYGVHATQGGRVIYTGSGAPQLGTIVSAEGARLRIRLDDRPDYVGLYHPTWELEYLDDPATIHARRPFVDDVCPSAPSRRPPLRLVKETRA